MNFILRAVLILLIFSFVVYVLKAIARLTFNVRKTVKDVRTLRDEMGGDSASRTAGRRAVRTDMVPCAACGAFVAARDAMTISSGARAVAFCSKECLEAHVRSA